MQELVIIIKAVREARNVQDAQVASCKPTIGIDASVYAHKANGKGESVDACCWKYAAISKAGDIVFVTDSKSF